MRLKNSSTWNISSIMLGALALGFSLGLPLGYITQQFYAGALDSNLAFLQNEQN